MQQLLNINKWRASRNSAFVNFQSLFLVGTRRSNACLLGYWHVRTRFKDAIERNSAFCGPFGSLYFTIQPSVSCNLVWNIKLLGLRPILRWKVIYSVSDPFGSMGVLLLLNYFKFKVCWDCLLMSDRSDRRSERLNGTRLRRNKRALNKIRTKIRYMPVANPGLEQCSATFFQQRHSLICQTHDGTPQNFTSWKGDTKLYIAINKYIHIHPRPI
jgi:hypothetical protein